MTDKVNGKMYGHIKEKAEWRAVTYSLTEIKTETENITYSLTETEIKTKTKTK